MVAEAVAKYSHALIRDLIALGKNPDDMFKTPDLSLTRMISIVVASPPGSALRYWMDAGWSRTDHLLANMAEADANVAHLTQPYERPGLGDRVRSENMFPAEAMTWEEMDALDAARASRPRGKTRVKVWS